MGVNISLLVLFPLQSRLEIFKLLIRHLVCLVKNLLNGDHLRDVKLEHVLDSVLEGDHRARAAVAGPIIFSLTTPSLKPMYMTSPPSSCTVCL